MLLRMLRQKTDFFSRSLFAPKKVDGVGRVDGVFQNHEFVCPHDRLGVCISKNILIPPLPCLPCLPVRLERTLQLNQQTPYWFEKGGRCLCNVFEPLWEA